jgi:hypothetical protein
MNAILRGCNDDPLGTLEMSWDSEAAGKLVAIREAVGKLAANLEAVGKLAANREADGP